MYPKAIEPEADEEPAADHDDADEPHRVARKPPRPPLRLPRARLVPEQERHAEDRGVEDELLPHRVDAAHVEGRPHHDIRRVAQRHDDPVEDEAVRAAVVAERRQPGDRPGEERAEPEQRRPEDAQPHPPAHRFVASFFRSWPRTRAIAARITSG